MFHNLLTFLTKAFTIGLHGLDWILFTLKKFWIITIATIITLVGFLRSVIVLVGDLITETINLMTSFIVNVPADHSSVSSDILEVFQIANTFFPLEECFIYISALSLLWIAGLTYRAIKSWIPTVS